MLGKRYTDDPPYRLIGWYSTCSGCGAVFEAFSEVGALERLAQHDESGECPQERLLSAQFLREAMGL